ncbi:MAG TPA: apolipoprotein N-acyltransferase [Pyrinomonadaceae bacterium]|nr:apolipoprotein N-acyltransferase [Pyrinomonadaceae bacterium]
MPDQAFGKLAAMQDVVSTPSEARPGSATRISKLAARVRVESPSLIECSVALLSAVLLIIAFPDFNLWPLAWFSLIPLLLLVAHKPQPWRCFFLGWLFGSVFFYGSCYWLTYSMIHTGGLSPWIAYPLLAPGAVLLAVFPALFTLLLARAIRNWGASAILLAPLFWAALEWARLQTTGQLWNAIGYSQAYHPLLIQTARWGGVYTVGFLVLMVNALLAYALVKRTARSLMLSATMLVAGVMTILAAAFTTSPIIPSPPDLVVIAVQPDVPMQALSDPSAIEALISRHLWLSTTALERWERDGRSNNSLPLDGQRAQLDSPEMRRAIPRLVVWPESPMNFAYGSDNQLRERLATFAKANRTSVLLNSQELAPNDGIYNSALLINEEGKLVVQYDKIRLLPFGEYVPLPRWLPGSGLITSIVGDFTPGAKYPLMPLGRLRAGVFICIESAYPAIARRFTYEGADALINISNDGYLGPTAVMRQHLANAVFRAVENQRPVLRATNTGITAFITPSGDVIDATEGFKPEVRIWTIAETAPRSTFYTKHGDLFAVTCALFSLLIFVLTFRRTS